MGPSPGNIAVECDCLEAYFSLQMQGANLLFVSVSVAFSFDLVLVGAPEHVPTRRLWEGVPHPGPSSVTARHFIKIAANIFQFLTSNFQFMKTIFIHQTDHPTSIKAPLTPNFHLFRPQTWFLPPCKWTDRPFWWSRRSGHPRSLETSRTETDQERTFRRIERHVLGTGTRAAPGRTGPARHLRAARAELRLRTATPRPCRGTSWRCLAWWIPPWPQRCGGPQ